MTDGIEPGGMLTSYEKAGLALVLLFALPALAFAGIDLFAYIRAVTGPPGAHMEAIQSFALLWVISGVVAPFTSVVAGILGVRLLVSTRVRPRLKTIVIVLLGVLVVCTGEVFSNFTRMGR